MFQFPGFASTPYVFRCRYPHGWVSPFGNPRINDRSHLPAAYRSVPRPSSPLGAKASTERSYRAQYIPPMPARRTKPHDTFTSLPNSLAQPHSFTTCSRHRLSSSKPLARLVRDKADPVTNQSDSPVKHHTARQQIPEHRSKDHQPDGKPVVQQHTIQRGTSLRTLNPPDLSSSEPGLPGTKYQMETVGIEPTAPCLQSRCSTTELRPRIRECETSHKPASPGARG